MIYKFSQLAEVFKVEQIKHCFVDTTILFSASLPSDKFNGASESVFETLSKNSIAIFTNVNVRAEFLENHRRVLIPECLIDFLEDFGPLLEYSLFDKLRKHKTSYRRKVIEEKAKFDIHQIKDFRKLLSPYQFQDLDGWELLCTSYLMRKIKPIWTNLDTQLGLNFISLRSGDNSPYLNTPPEWEKTIDLMGRYGIASSDAMILNMFLCSKIPVLLTSDFEMAQVLNKEAKGSKKVFVPDSFFEASNNFVFE